MSEMALKYAYLPIQKRYKLNLPMAAIEIIYANERI